MGTANDVINQFKAWLAVPIKEVPDHSNKTAIGVEFGWNGVAWCSETCSVAMKRTKTPGFWTASVSQAVNDAKAGKNGLRWIPRERATEVVAGCFSTFLWSGASHPNDSHISLVIDPFSLKTLGTNGKFETIGGNENDQVFHQWRDCKFINGWILPKYDQSPNEEDDLTPEQDARLKNIEKFLGEHNDFIGTRLIEVRDAVLAELAAGNGGSGATADQLADELAQRLKKD